MKKGELRGIAEKEGDVFVARCWEVGTECHGATVEEALANLREITWEYLERHPQTNPAGEAKETIAFAA